MAEIIFVMMAGLLVITICTIDILRYCDNKNNREEYSLDKTTVKIINKHIEKVIQYESIYMIDCKLGENFSHDNGSLNELNNEQILEISNAVVNKVLQCIPDNMKLYYVKRFGAQWLAEYIKIYSMSFILNYANLTIESLSMIKKNK